MRLTTKVRAVRVGFHSLRRSCCVATILFVCVATTSRYSDAYAENAASQSTIETVASKDVRALIDRYLLSIDAADPELANGVWLQTPDASFIHPLGEESGWQQIKDHFYINLMGKLFASRQLKLVGDPDIRVFGSAAIARFHWDFVAKRRDNGDVVHTLGRESQVFLKQPDGRWLLAHVHYSGPAVKMDGTSTGF